MFSKFCFCISLKRGVLIFSILSAIISLALIGSYTVLVLNKSANPYAWYHILYLLVSSIDFLTTLPLIYGTLKNARYYLFPWIVFNLFFLLIVTIGSMVLTFVNYAVVTMLLLCGLYWYFWICVISLFKEMGMNNGRGRVVSINSESRYRYNV